MRGASRSLTAAPARASVGGMDARMGLRARAALAALAFAAVAALAAAEDRQMPVEFVNLWVSGPGADVLWTFQGGDAYWGGSVRFDALYTLDAGRADATERDRGRTEAYIVASLLARRYFPSSRDGMIFLYGAGFNLAFEGPSVLRRDFLIPYLGLEACGMTVEGRGTGFAALPVLGLAIFSKPRFSLDLEGGLLLSTLSISDFLGIRARLSCLFAF